MGLLLDCATSYLGLPGLYGLLPQCPSRVVFLFLYLSLPVSGQLLTFIFENVDSVHLAGRRKIIAAAVLEICPFTTEIHQFLEQVEVVKIPQSCLLAAISVLVTLSFIKGLEGEILQQFTQSRLVLATRFYRYSGVPAWE